MKPRSHEYLQTARTRLRSAKTLVVDDPSAALSTAYYAALYVARAALSEHDISPRTHRGAWHEFRERFVVNGPIDADLATTMQRLQTLREQADYDATEIPSSDAQAAIRRGRDIHRRHRERPQIDAPRVQRCGSTTREQAHDAHEQVLAMTSTSSVGRGGGAAGSVSTA